MPSANELNIAPQVSGTGQKAGRLIPRRPLLSLWSSGDLGGKAILADVGVPELLRLKRHVPNSVAFRKSFFSGVVPVAGLWGKHVDREGMGLWALPAKPKEMAA